MRKAQIKQLIEAQMSEDGLIQTTIKGVQLFRVTESIPCAPAVYEPTIVAIVSGSKEAIFQGKRHVYGSEHYMCCTMSLPVEAGTPEASPEEPLYGIYISLDTKVMTQLTVELENSGFVVPSRKHNEANHHGITLARWNESFTDALWRLVELLERPTDAAILGEGRLRELYYAVMQGEAATAVRQTYAVGNGITRAIEYLSDNLSDTITIDDMAAKVGMSRAAFHRKFKQATEMSPIQFVKSMRLNNAAMKIANGINVNQAALAVGYQSSSQFSREFKRMYGQSPKQWRQLQPQSARG